MRDRYQAIFNYDTAQDELHYVKHLIGILRLEVTGFQAVKHESHWQLDCSNNWGLVFSKFDNRSGEMRLWYRYSLSNRQASSLTAFIEEWVA